MSIFSNWNIGLLRKTPREWYTIAPGDWSNPNIWVSNGKSKSSIPRATDNVTVSHDVTFLSNTTVNNLTVTGSISASSSVTVTINGNFNSSNGVVAGSNWTLTLKSLRNNIGGLFGTVTVTYSSTSFQYVSGITYPHNVTIEGGAKEALGDVNITGALTIRDSPTVAYLQMGAYSLSCTSLATVSGGLLKSGSVGSMTFHGGLSMYGGLSYATFTGTFPITIKSSLIGYANGNTDFGNAAVTFAGTSGSNVPIYTSNSTASHFVFRSPVIVDDVIVNILSSAGTNNVYTFGTVNGTTAGSKWLIGANTNYFIGSTTMPMGTGIFDYLTNANTYLAFVYNGDLTIPYTTFKKFGFGGTGTKTIASNTTMDTMIPAYNAQIISGTLGTLVATADMTVNGVLSTSSGTVRIANNSSTALLVTGLLDCYQGTFAVDAGYTPTLEFRGSIQGYVGGGVTLRDAIVNFTTNNQYIAGQVSSFNFSSSGAINIVGISLSFGTLATYSISAAINGSNSSSTAIIASGATFNYSGTTEPMITGVLDTSTYSNTFIYNKNNTQVVKANVYSNLIIDGGNVVSTKTALGNIVVNGNLVCRTSGILQMGDKSLTVNGTTQLSTSGGLYKNSATGTMTFTGSLFVQGGDNGNKLDWSGNPTVVFKGGISFLGIMSPFNMGTGSKTFNTNNQTITGYVQAGGFSMLGNTTIDGVTVTNTVIGTALTVGEVNGTNGSSVFVNNAGLNFADSTAANGFMSTGVATIASAGTLYYSFSGDYTIPYTSVYNLQVSSSGIKTLSGDTTVNGNLTITGSCTFQPADKALTVNGVTLVSSTGTKFYKSSATGSLLFKGVLQVNIGDNDWEIDLSTGNPAIEFRGGISISGVGSINLGSGAKTFTTNNQSVLRVSNSGGLNFNGNLTISGAITVTWLVGATGSFVSGVIDGDNASSKLLMGANAFLDYPNSTKPMATGILDASTNLNTFRYNKSGAQDVTGGTYRNLTFAGSGAKTLQGNVSVVNTFSDTGNLKVDNGYTFGNP